MLEERIFEYFVLEIINPYLKTDTLQFAYKPHSGCSNSIFLLRRTIQHFNRNGSNVFIASLDATKAFDKINHYKLFSTLYNYGLPDIIINTIVNWYTKLFVRVKWGNSLSSPFNVKSGVRQGGVLSGPFFNLYVNIILTKLRSSNLGCHLKNMYTGSLMYADDLILLSSSLLELQQMLNICFTTCTSLAITFNFNKSKTLIIGPSHLSISSHLILGHTPLPWTKNLDYLGITISSGPTFNIDLNNTRRKFFRTVNQILSKCTFTSDLVKLSLLESYALPVLMYAVESLNLPTLDLITINSWWNSVYRKIFHYHKWESVRLLISYLNRLDFLHLCNLRTVSFTQKMLTNNNPPNQILTRLVIISIIHMCPPMNISIFSKSTTVPLLIILNIINSLFIMTSTSML